MRALGTSELCITLHNDVPTLVLGQCKEGDERAILRRLTSVLSERSRGQQLKKVVFLPSALPRTATGKIKRWEIRRELEIVV